MQGFGKNLGVCALILGWAVLASATPGSFRGTIVDNPNASKGWIYVQGRNGTARRVEVSHAKIEYDEDVPAAERNSKAEEALVPGSEVRVTAEQGSDGEWHAERVEILKPAEKKRLATSFEPRASS
jgi:hypothetical protein